MIEILLLLVQSQQPEPKVICTPRYQLSVATNEIHVMFDKDGDHWVILNNNGTGAQILGYINKKDQFCHITEGQTLRKKT